jgi:hypothetical protein
MLQATIIAIGALSNVACAVGLGLTPEQFQAGLTTAFATGTGKADQP